METVLKVAFSEKRNLPTFRLKSSDTILLSGYMKKWVGAYLAGYNNRPSVRTGNCSGTHPDPMAKTILRARIPGLENNLADKIVAGHSLLMTIENNIGELLEEYLAVKLSPLGWYCCWGSTIDAVDFCKADGSLLQIKTSDNSENSSSSRVRRVRVRLPAIAENPACKPGRQPPVEQTPDTCRPQVDAPQNYPERSGNFHSDRGRAIFPAGKRWGHARMVL